MSLLNQRVASTLEEINDIDYELIYIPGKDNIIAYALSRSLESTEDNTPVEIKPTVPSGMTEVKLPGGGDSLFQCLSLFMHGNSDEHLKIREQVMMHIQENRKMYNIPTGRSQVEITRYLNLLKKSGQMPPPLAIEAFANLNKVQVWVYYDGNTLLKYGPEDSKNICKLLYLAGVHYNFLFKLPVAKATNDNTQSDETSAIQTNAVEFQEFTLLNESFEENAEDLKINLPISPEVKTEGEDNTDTTLILNCIRGVIEDYIEGSINLDGFSLSSDDIRRLQQDCSQLRKVIRAVNKNLLF